MTDCFLDALASDGLRSAREATGVAGPMDVDQPGDRFSELEAAFIVARDSFYLASVAPTGWPYIQHRGGPPGFLRVLDESTLGFADFRGNRQYLTLGNLGAGDRVALFLMDYPHRRRLKILARMAPHDLAAEPDLAARLATPGYRGVAERGFTLRLHAFDWNCPQHITPRFTQAEVEAAAAPLRARLHLLETENRHLRGEQGSSS
ncbi:MAG: pyridoxamine 5'-phosphate oxidase family protein [Azospirillaceae bacterium]|nr:pyridoxamine 5'-phosphate oxidase family protein [Azospirillaceae bacterium]